MSYIVGIDEVGRACLAGPITVTALAIPSDFDFRIFDFDLGIYSEELNGSHKHLNARPVLRDSKKLTLKQRIEWVEKISRVSEIKYVTENVKARIIDDINIANAANLAVFRAIKKLNKVHGIEVSESVVYLDGGLFIRGRRFQESNFPNASTVIKGDELIPVVSLASIVAKVHRDHLMSRLARVYPQYGFETHKGYPTKVHREALREHGVTEFHRQSFLRKVLA